MSYSIFGPSRITQVNMNNFSPSAQCDLSGLIVLHKDLRPVYQWAGNTLVNTGLLAEKSLVDKPNPVFKTPRVFRDPRPQMNARPYPKPSMED